MNASRTPLTQRGWLRPFAALAIMAAAPAAFLFMAMKIGMLKDQAWAYTPLLGLMWASGLPGMLIAQWSGTRLVVALLIYSVWALKGAPILTVLLCLVADTCFTGAWR